MRAVWRFYTPTFTSSRATCEAAHAEPSWSSGQRIRVRNGRLSLTPVMGLNVPEVRIYALGFMGVNLPMAPGAPHGFDLMPYRFGIRDGDPLTALFDLALFHHAEDYGASLSRVNRGQFQTDPLPTWGLTWQSA